MVQVRAGVITEVKAPRAYQSEILQVCQKRNAIVRLDTGMGKTFIAIMLLRWITSLPRKDDTHRLCVFLVPTVALVDQQSEAIANQTSLRVRPYRGDLGVEFWDTTRWTKELEDADCVVMTAAIWLNVLLHGYWTLDKVTAMVFDECHHAQKRHPYNQIMQEYHRYKVEREPGQSLPHILGLTASPIFNPDNPEEHFKELEANLDAVLVNVRDAQIDAAGYILRPKEKAIYYSSHSQMQGETDFEVMLDELEIWDLIEEHKVRMRIDNIKKTLGDLACDVYISNWLHSLCDHTATKSSLAKIRKSGRVPDVERLYKKMQIELAKMPYYTLGAVSDKVKSLVNLLAGYKEKKGFQAIIFVQQRHHAQALAMILSKSQALQTFIRAMHFVGHGASGAERLASEGMEAKAQRRVLQQFREGTLNVLIATNVAEEGLDFQACNLIVRFDFMPTYKGYVQSRGRARKKDSEFVVMLDRDEPKDAMRWKQYVGAEKQLDDIYAKREPDDDLDEPELENTPRYYSSKTGAVLTYASAVALLDEICALIPSDAYSPPSRPRYDLDEYAIGKQFSCKVFLPMMPLLPPNEREICGQSVTTKRGAKQAVAFEACMKLHKLGILSDHLLPIREGKGDFARDADDELVDRTVLPMHQEVDVLNPFGNLWSAEKPPVWINEVRIVAPDGNVSRFALICATRLDLHTPLIMHEPGKQFTVRITSLRKHIWSAELRYTKLAKLDKFTRWMIKQVINRKLIQGPLIYLVAPLFKLDDGSYDIDWDVIDEPFKSVASLVELSNGNLVLAPWQFMRKHIFTIHEIRRDLNSLNMPRITGLTKRGRIFDRTANFGDALTALLDYEGIDPKLNMREEMLHLKPWFSIRNNLNPVKAHSSGSAVATAPTSAAMSRDPSNQEADPAIFDAQTLDDDNDDIPLPAWELPDWKWRQYKVKQHEVDEEAGDMLDPEDSVTRLDPLPVGQTTATSLDVTNAFVLPWSLCKVSNIDIGVWNAFSWLPSLLRAIHDQARTQHAMREMSLPPLQFALVNQALTLPMCCVGKDYQTLETIGDSALKLAVTVVVYNRYVAKDEGGLSARRMNSIDNQHLRMKAVKKGLQNHLFTEFFRLRTWTPPTLENGTINPDGMTIRRRIPRRALSDCIESLLGAAYLSGGFDAVLRTGDALGLCFGGSTPWHERYTLSEQVRQLPVGVLLRPLEEQLGYRFKHGQLLTQAVTHRSFSSGSTHCQEREEFLGDAVLDNFIIDRLSRRFPTATPSHLTRLRSVLVSNSALGYLSLKVLGLHRYILHSTPHLDQHFKRALEEAHQLVYDDFVQEIWLFDPPKPAADAVEGIIGSIFIDCGWRLEPVYEVLDRMFENLFKLMPTKESAPRDPTSRLRLYLQHKRCKELEIKSEPRPDLSIPARVRILWHGDEVSHIQHHSQASAKQLASKVAFSHIRELGDDGFSKICTCKDDLKERVGELTDWKKGIVAALAANKDILDDREGARPVDDYLAEDMGKKDEMLKDARELALEKVMEESYGYNPQAPQEEEEEAQEAQLEPAEAAPRRPEEPAIVKTSTKLEAMLIDFFEPDERAIQSQPSVSSGTKSKAAPDVGRNSSPMDWELSIGMLETKQSTFGGNIIEQDGDEDDDDDDDLLIVLKT